MKKIIFSTVAFCVVIILLFGVSEIILRWKGYSPWTSGNQSINEPTMLRYEPVLGWTSKKGHYFVPPYVPGEKGINVTFTSDGIRATGADSGTGPDSPGEILVVGCSFTQGWAISDSDTYAWKLQEIFPSLKVLNFGVGGYGTYQSLLVLEKELPRMKSPQIVLYGFIIAHELRNVASIYHLKVLQASSKKGHVYVPYVTFDDAGMLVRHPAERYPETPLREYSAAIAYFESKFMQFKNMRRDFQKRMVTEKLILEMKKISDRFGARFIVPILWMPDSRQEYINFFKNNNIEFIDCSYNLTPELRVPGEGHPNGKLNSLWAECIASSLRKYIAP